jgi:hypothetical protein
MPHKKRQIHLAAFSIATRWVLYFGRNSMLRAAPLSNAKCSGSSSPGWHTPLCGPCVPHSTGTWGLRAPPQRLAHW